MKQQNKVMSAEEYFLFHKPLSSSVNVIKLMDGYANYILSQRIDELAERIKNGATYTHCLKNATANDRDGFHFVITQDNIEKIANDYKTELNLNK